MARLSPETIWNTNEKELLNILDEHTLVPKPDKVYFYAPSFMYYRTKHYKSQPNHFPTISITGAGCALNCKHCAGKILETMQPACTPEKLFELCAELKLKGALGCLVSGGCQPDGSVPLKDFVPALERIKRELDLTVLVHTGIVDFATAKALKNAHVDTALIDIIGSEETIKEVYNLNVTVKDYANSLDALHESGLPFVPHIIVGLHNGTLKGEFQALTMIKPHKPSALVVIAFMPIRGTPMSLYQTSEANGHSQNPDHGEINVSRNTPRSRLHATERQTPRRNRRSRPQGRSQRNRLPQRRSRQICRNPEP